MELTGAYFGTTENDALSDWLTAGARFILNAMPMPKLERVICRRIYRFW